MVPTIKAARKVGSRTVLQALLWQIRTDPEGTQQGARAMLHELVLVIKTTNSTAPSIKALLNKADSAAKDKMVWGLVARMSAEMGLAWVRDRAASALQPRLSRAYERHRDLSDVSLRLDAYFQRELIHRAKGSTSNTSSPGFAHSWKIMRA